RPVQVEARITGDAGDGVARLVRPDRDRLAGDRERRDEDAEPLADRDVPLIGRGQDRSRVVRDEVDPAVAAVPVDAEEHGLAALAAVEEDPVAGAVVPGPRAVLRDEDRLAAAGRDAVDAGIPAVIRAAQPIAADPAVDDLGAVRRERRLDVVAGPRRQLPAPPAIRADGPDCAELVVAP